MAKVDYSKAEREFEKTLEKLQAKELAEGKTPTSRRAADYFGLAESTARPVPKDPVESLLENEAAKSSQDETTTQEQQLQESEEDLVVERIPETDMLQPIKSKARPVKSTPPPSFPEVEKMLEHPSSLIVLKKHLLWLHRQKINDRYEQLGTTREEIAQFSKARRLTPSQLQRIHELNEKAKKLLERVLKKRGIQTDTALIEHEQQRHKRKRHQTRETWLQL
jgi:hypothetical protein